MTTKYWQIALAVVGVSTIGLATVAPIRQAHSQNQPVAAQPAQDSDFFMRRAMATMEKGNSPQEFQSALQDLDQAIKLNPQNAMAYAQKGSILWSDDRKAGMQNFDRAVELAPDNVEVRGYRASFRELSQDDRGAIADLNHMLKLAPEQSEPRYLRAIILRRDAIKDYKAALADLDYLIEKDQELQHRSQAYRGSRYQMRGWLRDKLGDTKGAIADLQLVESEKDQELKNNQREQQALEMELADLRSRLKQLRSKK
jgi:hypothetical protein